MKELMKLVEYMDKEGITYDVKGVEDGGLKIEVEYGDMIIIVKEDGKMNVSFDDRQGFVRKIDTDAFYTKLFMYNKFIG